MRKKIVLDVSTWLELEAELAALIVDSEILDPWFVTQSGDAIYTEDAQESFNAASDRVSEVLSAIFEKGES